MSNIQNKMSIKYTYFPFLATIEFKIFNTYQIIIILTLK